MQFSCESCKTQLQIADDKVRGKRLIVRCKRCGAKISISDPALGAARPRPVAGPSASAPPPAISAPPPPVAPAKPVHRDSDTDSTRAMDSDLLEQALQASKVDESPRNAAPSPSAVVNPAPSAGPPAEPVDAPLWFAMLHGKQTGPFTRAELGARTDEGVIGPRTYLWKDGMSAWQRAKDLPELEGLFPQLPEAPPIPPPVAPRPVAALREFASPDFASKPTPAEAVSPVKRSAGPAKPSAAPAAKPSAAPAAKPASAPAAKPSAAPAKSSTLPAKPSAPSAKSSPLPGKPSAAPGRKEEEPTAVGPLPFGDLVHQEDVARELFAAEKGSAQKPADLAGWAARELEKKSSPSRPSATPAPRMFEGASEARNRGPFVLLVLGVAAVLAVVLWLALSGPRAPPPPQKKEEEAKAAPPPAAPVTTAPPEAEKPKPAPKPDPSLATGLTADQVRRKLDENKGALQGCIDEALRRDPNLRVGKIHIATTIAPTGAVTQAKVDKTSVDQSPLGACLRRATKKIAFPVFSGDAFDVDIPIVVTAGK